MGRGIQLRRILCGFVLTLLIVDTLVMTSRLAQVHARSEPINYCAQFDGGATTRGFVVMSPGTITVPDDYATIQQAINSANGGDTVFVRSGTYYESVVVNKTITLIGENPYSTTINGSLSTTVVSIVADDAQVSGFRITFGGTGVSIGSANHVTITNNLIDLNGGSGIVLYMSNDDTIVGNTVSNVTATRSSSGFAAFSSNGSVIYHNNFVNDLWAPGRYVKSFNEWDDGYPSGGNYWVNANPQYPGEPPIGPDVYSGPYQNETGSDGIVDGQRYIDSYNVDRYPLAKPYPWGLHDIGVTYIGEVWKSFNVIIPLKTIVGIGFKVDISVFVMNYGSLSEVFDVTVYANTTVVGTITNVVLAGRESVIIDVPWNPSGFAVGYYVIEAYATPVSGETDVTDNTVLYGPVYVGIPGDVNADGKVDIVDLLIVAKAYGSNVADPRYVANLDINNSGTVDIIDILITAKSFGRTS